MSEELPSEMIVNLWHRIIVVAMACKPEEGMFVIVRAEIMAWR
jgi:hypothetical protein